MVFQVSRLVEERADVIVDGMRAVGKVTSNPLRDGIPP
jgi:hypothetical protein